MNFFPPHPSEGVTDASGGARLRIAPDGPMIAIDVAATGYKTASGGISRDERDRILSGDKNVEVPIELTPLGASK